MFRLALVIASVILLAGCATTSKAPATVQAECSLLRDPGFPVRGSRDKDQKWITRTQEAGIASCGWPRPAPEKEVPTVAEAPALAPAPPPPVAKKGRLRTWLGV
jgi:hypothetical protein